MSDNQIAEQKQAFLSWFQKTWDNEKIDRIELQQVGQYGQNAHVTHWYTRPVDDATLAETIYEAAIEDAKSFAGTQKYCVLVFPKVEADLGVVGADPSGIPSMPSWVRMTDKPSRKLFSVLGGEQAEAGPTEKLYETLLPSLQKAISDIGGDKIVVERLRTAGNLLLEIVHKEGYSREKIPQQTALAVTYAMALETAAAVPSSETVQ